MGYLLIFVFIVVYSILSAIPALNDGPEFGNTIMKVAMSAGVIFMFVWIPVVPITIIVALLVAEFFPRIFKVKGDK